MRENFGNFDRIPGYGILELFEIIKNNVHVCMMKIYFKLCRKGKRCRMQGRK